MQRPETTGWPPVSLSFASGQLPGIFQSQNDHRKQDGQPASAVIPYQEFERLKKKLAGQDDDETTIPHEVVRFSVLKDVHIIRAWREYLNLTQQEVADQAGMKQPTYAKLEKPNANPRMATLKKIARAMGIKVEQLQV